MKERNYTHKLTLAGLLTAIGVWFSLLKVVIGTGVDASRFTPVNVPILLAGAVLGPVWGALVGFSTDLLGCFVCGYAFNPMINLGAILVGAVCGSVYRACGSLTARRRALWLPQRFLYWFLGARLLLAVIAGHLIGSVIVKTAGLILWYGSPRAIIVERVAVYAVQIVVDYNLAKRVLPLAKGILSGRFE